MSFVALFGFAMAASPPSHPLVLDARVDPAAHRIDLYVSNPTEAPVWLQIMVPDHNVLTTAVTDAKGAAVVPTPGPPNGMPLWTHRFDKVLPDTAVQVAQFALDPERLRAVDNARTWDLDAHAGTPLTVAFALVVECDTRTLDKSTVPPMPGRDNAAPPGRIEDIFCGSVSTTATLGVPPPK